jgi:ADP-ribosylglycohydrolase
MQTPSPIDRARRSLEGLSIGDAFGEKFFGREDTVKPLISARTIPRAPWKWTDDTAMALSVVDILEACGQIDEQLLATLFAKRFRAEPGRG